MSQQTYTFACPVCAVRLSVPKALAGVRGPCPQCHHDITAPEPETALAPALASAGASGAQPVTAPLPVDPPLPGRLVSPSALVSPPPLPPPPASVPRPVDHPAAYIPPPIPSLAEAREALPAGGPPALPGEREAEPGPVAAPTTTAISTSEDPPVEAMPPEATAATVTPRVLTADADLAEEAPIPRQPQPPRRSRVGMVVAVLLVLGLLAAAALNLLPRHSLRLWLGKALPAQTVDAMMGPAPTVAVADTAATTPQAETVPSRPPTVVDPGNPGISVDPAPSPVDIRPALTAPEIVAEAPEAPVGPTQPAPAPEAVAAEAAVPAPAIDPVTESAAVAPEEVVAAPVEPEASPVPAPPAMEVPSTPGTATAVEAGVASLLPDISGGAPSEAVVVDEARAGAQEALTLFLQARKWTDRLALSHGGDAVQSEMAAYYKKVKDGPNPPTSIDYIASGPVGADGRSTVEVFHVTFADLPQGFPVSVRQSEEGWKVDWHAFVEFRESRLKKFLAQYQEPPAVFRVRLQRARYQDNAVPKLDQKYVFRIAAPIDGHEGYVFVDKEDSIVGPKVADMLEWEDTHLVMAKLKWVRATSGRPYVELRDIVSQSWRETP